MKMTGSQRIAAPKQRVWQALNDPEILRRAIPGCQSLEKESDERFRAAVLIKIGPMDARFAGAVTLTDLNPPNACKIVGEGQAGPAGFAKGHANVTLTEEAGATVVAYDVDAQVGGRLAQLGGPIIDATAKQIAGAFFKRFGDIVAPPPEAASVTPPSAAAPSAGAPPPVAAAMPLTWMLAVVAALLAGTLLGGGLSTGAGWIGIAIGLLIVIVAAAAFEFGRRNAAPVIVLDPALLAKLLKPEPRE